MKPQAYQKPTIYNSDGTKAQIGTYDIRTDPLTNSKADGILDYINNNLEALHDKPGNYLPLSGGTMTGDTLITMGNGESYVRNWSTGLYLGGTNGDNASRLVLFTNSSANGFQLHAGNGTTVKRMIGKPDGTLTWADKTVIVGTEATGTFTFNINANEAKTVGILAHTPKYYSMMATGTGFANCVFNISTYGAVWCTNFASVARTNITVKVNYIY